MSPSEKANREFWVGRRSEQPKAGVKLSTADFVSEANRRLQSNIAHRPGTRFVLSTSGGSVGQTVPTWEGPREMRSLVQRIVHDMTSKFEMEVPFRIDNGK